MKKRGRRRIRSPEYWRAYYTQKQREWRAAHPRHNGNWWRTIHYAAKLAYMIGYIDCAVWVTVDKETGSPFSSDDRPEQSVRDLDAFYENPRNRCFTVPLVLGAMDKLKARR
jgi:hypothetical protein